MAEAVVAAFIIGIMGGLSVSILLVTITNIQWVRTANDLLKKQGSRMRLVYRGFWTTSKVVWIGRLEEWKDNESR